MKGFEVVERFPMHWGDMDALGHANNTIYFRWFETARITYFRRMSLEADRPSDVGPILASTSCDFLRPIVYPASLAVGARTTKIGTKSFTMEYRIALAEDEDTPFAKGTAIVVLYDYRAGASIPIPDDLRNRILSLDASLRIGDRGA